LVKIADIYLFEIVGNYTRVYFNHNKPLLYKSLNQIEEKLPSTSFFRANRQQIINTSHIENVIPWFSGKLKLELTNNKTVEISRRQSQSFKELLSI
jgi:two-component system LytT family response regulator